MSTLLDDVHYLAGTIGPRGTGTPAESAAAEYVSHRLSCLGLAPAKYAFHAVPSQNAFPIAISSIALLSVVIYPMNLPVTGWLAVFFSLGAAWLLWQTIRSAFNPLISVLPKVRSQNIEARIKSKKKNPRHKAVLLSHLDTNRCRLIWQSRAVQRIEPMTWLTLSVPICMGMFYLAGILLRGRVWWWISLPLAAYELGTILTLIRDDHTPYSPGAHDNAASVAVSLDVASRLYDSPLQNTEVWLIFDGAEETDHAGVLDLLRRHGDDLREAAFLGLEGLGSGEIVYLTRQGICAPYHPTPDLLAIAEQVSAKHPELNFQPAQMLIEDDVRTLFERSYHAIGIAGRDQITGVLPYWHRPDDTPDNVSNETMQKAVKIVLSFLDELDTA